MDVGELMSAPVHNVAASDSLNCAVKLMRDQAVGCLPVVGDDGRLVGIITDRDIALAAHEHGEALWRLRIDASMTQPVYSCRPSDGLDVAARLMRQHRVRRLPVVDGDGKPIGIISLDDLAHASRQPIMEPIPGLTADEIDDTYHAVSGRSRHQR